MTKYELLLKKAGGEHYWTERFESLSDLQKWLEHVQTEPSWLPGNTYEIVDKTAEVAAFEAARSARIAAENAKREAAILALKSFKTKSTRGVTDAIGALDAVLDVLLPDL